jgi:hypothetical protein
MASSLSKIRVRADEIIYPAHDRAASRQMLSDTQVCHRQFHLIAVTEQCWHQKLASPTKYHAAPPANKMRRQLSADIVWPGTALGHAGGIEGLLIRGDVGVCRDYAVKGRQNEPVSLMGVSQDEASGDHLPRRQRNHYVQGVGHEIRAIFPELGQPPVELLWRSLEFRASITWSFLGHF